MKSKMVAVFSEVELMTQGYPVYVVMIDGVWHAASNLYFHMNGAQKWLDTHPDGEIIGEVEERKPDLINPFVKEKYGWRKPIYAPIQ